MIARRSGRREGLTRELFRPKSTSTAEYLHFKSQMNCSGDLTFYFWWIIVLPLGHISDRRGHRHPAGEKSAFYLFFFLLFCGLRFFSCWFVFFFRWSNLLCSPLKHFECFWTEYSSCWIAPKNRLDVSAQFFRDGKLKHRCVRYC